MIIVLSKWYILSDLLSKYRCNLWSNVHHMSYGLDWFLTYAKKKLWIFLSIKNISCSWWLLFPIKMNVFSSWIFTVHLTIKMLITNCISQLLMRFFMRTIIFLLHKGIKTSMNPKDNIHGWRYLNSTCFVWWNLRHLFLYLSALH